MSPCNIAITIKNTIQCNYIATFLKTSNMISIYSFWTDFAKYFVQFKFYKVVFTTFKSITNILTFTVIFKLSEFLRQMMT